MCRSTRSNRRQRSRSAHHLRNDRVGVRVDERRFVCLFVSPQKEIVKLDRSVVVRAEVDPHARRIASQMVSLLHECGCLVLMEGIENGKYFELYDKWFGPKGELPYPMSAAVRTVRPGRLPGP